MPIEAKDFAEVLGIEDPSKIENAEALKTELEKKWVLLSSAHTNKAVTDKVWGSVNRAGRKKFEDLNTAFELGVEIDDKADLLDLIPKFTDALKPRFDGIKELQDKVKNSAPADVVAQHEVDKKKWEKEMKASKDDAVRWKGEFDNLSTTVQTRDKNAKVEGEWSKGMAAVQFSTQVDSLRKEGFNSMVRKEVEILLDEDGNPYAAYADGPKKGEPLMHPRKAAEKYPLPDYLKDRATELKLIGQNPQGGRPANAPVIRAPQEAASTPTYGRRERRPPDRIMP